MAIHDMRNPTNAIIFGLSETIQMLLNQKKKIESIRSRRNLRYEFINQQVVILKSMTTENQSERDSSSL